MGVEYKGKKIMIDTNCFIYLIESKHYPDHLSLVEKLFTAVNSGVCQGITSPITLIEIMTLPRKTGREDLACLYKSLITNFPNLTIIPLDTEIADRAAAIRSTYNLKTPDAVQVATGLISKASLFVTFDKELERVTPLINVYIPQKI